MAEARVQRRLAAILAADVAGYSRLMGEDEAGTHARIRSLQSTVIEPQAAAHGGRIFKTTGDGFLLEFASAVDAVSCAIGIQRAAAARGKDHDSRRPLALRMGVNLGDVILEGEDLFGDGVNVAARLEAFAEPGHVCLSEDVYRQVRGKVDAAFEDAGLQRFKNIADPVRVYRLQIPAAPAEGGVPRAAPRADKPSIAVLPFDNLSGDPAQEFFADGMTEDIITELSRFPGLFIIARNSTFSYKGKRVRIQDVARELSVQYVVEGSARRSGNRVRITAQLIDADTDAHIWAQRYDREIVDVFDVQDEIARTIAATLLGRLEAAHAERITRKPPQDMAAYECVLAAKVLHHRATRDDNAAAIDFVERAIGIDPRFAQAYAWKGCLLGQAAAFGFGGEPRELYARAYEYVSTGLSLDENDIECNRVLCEAHMARHELDRARAHHERAFALNPNDPRIVAQRGELLTWLGQPEEAIEWLRTSMRLDPFGVRGRAHLLGRALYVARRYGEAVDAYRQVAHRRFEPRADLAACLAQLGREAEARSEVAETLRLKPDFSSEAYVAFLPYARDDDRAHHREGLARAGLPG